MLPAVGRSVRIWAVNVRVSLCLHDSISFISLVPLGLCDKVCVCGG